jgi:hypothetical protein
MGYTHYWYRELKIKPEKMKAIADDFATIMLRLDDMGVRLADGLGKGSPEIGPDSIRFNGPENCGHPENAAIVIPWPTSEASGVTDGKGEAAGNWFAGALLETRCCGGDCSYETFNFPQTMTKEFLQASNSHKGLYFECCKTAYRPYDLAVNAFLVIAKHHLGDKISIHSDGNLNHWLEGIALCRVYLGYPEHYVFNADGELIPVAELPSSPTAIECGENFERCQHRASKHFPELEGTPSGELPMQTWLHGWKTADLTPDNAVAFIISGTRREKGGSAWDSAFGLGINRWAGRKWRGHSLWVCSLVGEVPDWPVAVKYKSGMKPYPGVQWVFPPTRDNPNDTIFPS